MPTVTTAFGELRKSSSELLSVLSASLRSHLRGRHPQRLATAYLLIHAENGDVAGSYASRDAAVERLASYIEADPDLQDELGIRVFSDGKPLGRWTPASEVL